MLFGLNDMTSKLRIRCVLPLNPARVCSCIWGATIWLGRITRVEALAAAPWAHENLVKWAYESRISD
jgi:hypothetical protein